MAVYDDIVLNCRELAIDLNPVDALTIQGTQGFVVSKDATTLVIDSESTLITDADKIYKYYKLLAAKTGLNVSLPDIYLPLEYTLNVTNFSVTDISAQYTIKLDNFFSDEAINKVIYNYFVHYKGLQYLDTQSTEEITAEVADYDLIYVKHIILWVSFYLLEEKRKRINSSSAYSDPSGNSDSSFASTDKSIVTTVGSAFTVNETPKSGGKDTEGFSALWGDEESVLSKVQISIRTEFEKLFIDYSLRDNTGVNIYAPALKRWKLAAYENSTELHKFTEAILEQGRMATQ